jgi:hypothetical protein
MPKGDQGMAEVNFGVDKTTIAGFEAQTEGLLSRIAADLDALPDN